MEKFTSSKPRALALTKCALVIAVYIVLTIVPPLNAISYGAIQCRLSEMLNYLVLYNKRYILPITLACAIANIYSFGPIDMVVGSLSSLVFLIIGRLICTKITNQALKFIVFALIMSIAILPIALEISLLFKVDFPITFGTMFVGEMSSMLLGAVVVSLVSKRVDLGK